VSDDSGVGDVNWDHGFLHRGIEHDLSRFGVTKDIEFCKLVKASTRGGDLEENYSPATAPRLPIPTPPPMKTISSTQ